MYYQLWFEFKLNYLEGVQDISELKDLDSLQKKAVFHFSLSENRIQAMRES